MKRIIGFRSFLVLLLCACLFGFSSIDQPKESIQNLAKKQLSTFSDEELDRDWCLDQFFGTVVVINLPQATQRLERITHNLSKIGLKNFEVYSAVNGRTDLPMEIWAKFYRNWSHIDTSTEEGLKKLHCQFKGEAGCFCSHYYLIKAVSDAYDRALVELKMAHDANDTSAIAAAEQNVRKHGSVLILEDDNGFGIVSEDKTSATLSNVGKIFRLAIRELPENWDMLYFMSLPKEPAADFSKHLKKIGRSRFANAYAVNHTIYKDMIKQLRKIEDCEIVKIESVDNEMGNLHPKHQVFATYPSIAYQHEGFNFITSKISNKLRQTQPLYEK